jgi:hypothetical protein
MKEREQIWDNGNVATFFVDDIAAVMTVGSVTHLIFTSRQPQVSESGRVYRVVEARVIVPNACVRNLGMTILRNQQLVPRQDEFEGMEDMPLH